MIIVPFKKQMGTDFETCHLASAVYSVASSSLGPQGLARQAPLSLGFSSAEVGCHFLLQGIFPTQGSNSCLPHLLHCRRVLYLGPPGKPATYTRSTSTSRLLPSPVCFPGFWISYDLCRELVYENRRSEDQEWLELDCLFPLHQILIPYKRSKEF